MAQSISSNYSPTQRLLHWTIALLIFFNLLFPDGMNAWHRIIRQGGTPSANDISSANIHAYVGIAILLLAIVRLGVRIMQGVPDETANEPALFRVAARLAHVALYLLIFALPLSGIAAYYFGIEVLGSIHAGVLKVLLWALVVAHIAGALAHQFYWKTDVLRRMTID
ncbi:cytochrome b/b6 domain-containing protein [Rhizobium calliandrae]|uniref:Cytochrome b/b6 domain-containing protein n=1 Tax=Rhizobium calliandrae TaxID=1312182 RepID=A0ABT7KS69_9HYPH|nr:cytochrome b/b6 domain-containing protein [Rhizobium calliandrae]MDL2410284.1 cytochrome b/b6 domain-containing protein [Rhizobium calliandrae]